MGCAVAAHDSESTEVVCAASVADDSDLELTALAALDTPEDWGNADDNAAELCRFPEEMAPVEEGATVGDQLSESE